MTSLRGSIAGVAAALAVLLVQSTPAASATLYDFSWSNGESRTAVGSLILGESVAVSDEFDKDDVLSFELELFDGSVSLGTGEFPPFDSVFHALNGTRGASMLEINDLYVTVPFGIRLGCTATDCLSGAVFHDDLQVDFGSRMAAQESFVFTEVPEPAVNTAAAAALAALVGLRAGVGRARI